MSSSIEIVKYDSSFEEKWDKFIVNSSVNGTFLQSRKFLNYHPADRFNDASLMIMKGTNIVGLVPMNVVDDGNTRKFYSHLGSTFGGILLNANSLEVATLKEIFDRLEDYFKQQKATSVLLKQTSWLYAPQNEEIIDYFLNLYGYSVGYEIGYYVDLNKCPEDIISAYHAPKRRNYKYSLRSCQDFRELTSDEDVRKFYDVLLENYKKFETTPVHTYEEILDLKNNKIPQNIKFYGVVFDGKVVAASMVFLFDKKVFHTQYLCCTHEAAANMFSNAFLYTNLIRQAKISGYRYLSFGTSTLEHGRVLNYELARFKEAFGTSTYVNRTYSKNIA